MGLFKKEKTELKNEKEDLFEDDKDLDSSDILEDDDLDEEDEGDEDPTPKGEVKKKTPPLNNDEKIKSGELDEDVLKQVIAEFHQRLTNIESKLFRSGL